MYLWHTNRDVMPAQAGIQCALLDPRLRGDDKDPKEPEE
jgi:hypothetical protein